MVLNLILAGLVAVLVVSGIVSMASDKYPNTLCFLSLIFSLFPFKLVNAGAPSQRAGERTPPPSGGALFAPDAAREVIAFPCYFMRRMV